MRLLVTGGSGFLGSKITRISVKRGYTTYSGYNIHQASNGIPVKFDICNKKAVIKCMDRIKPNAVVHAAAFTDVDRCEEETEYARRVNIKGTRNIVESCKCYDSFLAYISTDYVFSGEEGKYKETDKPKPINYYGWTKLEGEKIVKKSSIDWCIARPSVIFDSTYTVRKRNFALWVINRLLNRSKTKVINDQCVSPVLNNNLSKMILEVIDRRLHGIYHLAGATPISRFDFAKLLADTFHLQKELLQPIKSSDMKWRGKRPRNTSLNVAKAMKNLKNKPLQIHEAVRKMKEELNTYSIDDFPSHIQS